MKVKSSLAAMFAILFAISYTGADKARSEEPVTLTASDSSQATDRLSNVAAGDNQWVNCDSSCDTVGCGSLDCCCEPRREVNVSAIFMQRTGLDSTSLYVTNGGQDLLNADDFSFDWEPGIDVSIARRLDECWAVQGRYFWLNDQEARSPTFDLTLPDPNFIQTTPPTPTFGPSSNLFATYRAKLQSAEINAQRSWRDGLNVFVGYRFINFDEKLHIVEPVGGPGHQIWDARNNLHGGQVGVDGLLWCRNRLSVIGRASAGLYANDARSKSRVTEFGGATADSFSADSDIEAAFLGELNLLAEYRVNCRWSLVAGYQLLWLEGVAIAAEQVAGTASVFTGPPLTRIDSTVNANGDAFYHGARVGLEATW